MNNNNLVSIVIVNWNSGRQLADAIASIEIHHHDIVEAVIVIDNASTDDSLMHVESGSSFPFELMIIRNQSNVGFGAACNQGARLTGSGYVLFLNPDAIIESKTLSITSAFMKNPANAQVGICGVQLFDDSGQISRSCARFPSAGGFMAHAIGLDRLIPRLGHFMAEWPHDRTREVDHVIGAFFLVRRSIFDALGGFDERFFVYLEDLDFSYRAHQTGWRTVYLADAQAFHTGGGTSNQIKARRLFYALRSRLLYAFKHFGFPSASAVLLATLLVEPITRSVHAALRRSWSGIRETWSAYGMLVRWLPQWIFLGSTR